MAPGTAWGCMMGEHKTPRRVSKDPQQRPCTAEYIRGAAKIKQARIIDRRDTAVHYSSSTCLVGSSIASSTSASAPASPRWTRTSVSRIRFEAMRGHAPQPLCQCAALLSGSIQSPTLKIHDVMTARVATLKNLADR
jgi:hypothetical protein